jgi:hypothetical protein
MINPKWTAAARWDIFNRDDEGMSFDLFDILDDREAG